MGGHQPRGRQPPSRSYDRYNPSRPTRDDHTGYRVRTAEYYDKSIDSLRRRSHSPRRDEPPTDHYRSRSPRREADESRRYWDDEQTSYRRHDSQRDQPRNSRYDNHSTAHESSSRSGHTGSPFPLKPDDKITYETFRSDRRLLPEPQPGTTRDVVLQGLPGYFAAKQVKRELMEGQYVDLDRVADLRMGHPSNGWRQAYMSFTTADEAAEFCRKFPVLSIADTSGPGDDRNLSVSVKLTEERHWMCEACGFSNRKDRIGTYQCGQCHAAVPWSMYAALMEHDRLCREDQDYTYAQYTQLEGVKNTGHGDVGPQYERIQYLIFRHLKANVTPKVLADGAKKLLIEPKTDEALLTGEKKLVSSVDFEKQGARLGSIRRSLIVRDRVNKKSLGYGFVEFFTPEDAEHAIKKYRSLKSFTIASSDVEVGYMARNIFVPLGLPPKEGSDQPGLNRPIDEKYVLPQTITPVAACYYDPYAYISVEVIAENDPRPPTPPPAATAAPSMPVVDLTPLEKLQKKKKNKAVEPENKFAQWDARKLEILRPDTFVDVEKKLCYLCTTTLNDDIVALHETKSDLHLKNMEIEGKVKLAILRMERAQMAEASRDMVQEHLERAQKRMKNLPKKKPKHNKPETWTEANLNMSDQPQAVDRPMFTRSTEVLNPSDSEGEEVDADASENMPTKTEPRARVSIPLTKPRENLPTQSRPSVFSETNEKTPEDAPTEEPSRPRFSMAFNKQKGSFGKGEKMLAKMGHDASKQQQVSFGKGEKMLAKMGYDASKDTGRDSLDGPDFLETRRPGETGGIGSVRSSGKGGLGYEPSKDDDTDMAAAVGNFRKKHALLMRDKRFYSGKTD